MLFSSLLFLFRFLPIVLILYYISPPKLRNTTLFITSLIFYCWGEVRYFPVMVVTILINYLCALAVEKSGDRLFWRRFFLILSLVGSLGLLLYFKYSYFFVSNLNIFLHLGVSEAILKQLQTIVLPLGISFYTFQTLSYTIDVYWRRVPAERNIVNFGAYVVMFPQLIAGPIVRYSEINERLHVLKGRISIAEIDEGITQFIFGLAKKVLIADNISRLWADIVGQHSADGTIAVAGIGLENVSTPLAWLGILAFTIQIYFDFSGYSLMAIGMGKMLGFNFHENFNLPYISKSITEFWRRWHISLSSWFKEYVYIPLGGNRKGLPRQIFNILVVWFLTGFWHGANWNFILWGLYYFAFLVIEKAGFLKALQKGKVWPHIYTMFVVVVGWALFVGSDAGVGLGLLFNKLFVPQGGVGALYYLLNYIGPLALGVLFSTTLPQKLFDKIKHITVVRGLILGVLLVACVAYMVAGGYSPFLYFRF